MPGFDAVANWDEVREGISGHGPAFTLQQQFY